jgi:sec-independent protein translocase protein TatA
VIANLLTPTHIAILLVVLLLLFGAKRLPETGRALGQGMREFKDAIRGTEHPTGIRRTKP